MKLCLVCNFQTSEDQDVCPRDGSSMVTVGDDPLLGMVVEGRYKIQSVIGQGSAGTVYKAVQELIGREVAIKVLHDYLVSDDEFIKRFRQEAKASSRLSHPNIITIYDFGVIPEGDRPYIAMDLLIGTPLSDLLAQVERISLDEAIPIFVQVCSALGEAHRQGVVHRDVKPENIVLVERSGQNLFPIVVDFGIARIVEESDAAKITRTGTVCGSPTYMSPEQCTSSKVDHRSDIYSLAVVIYETLTGDVPFHSDELVRVMAMHLSDPPKPLNQVKPGLIFPDALEECVYRALAKNPDQRYQSMEEFAEALEASVKKPEKGAAQQTIPSRPKKKELEPGPLAQDEALHSRSQSQEMSAPQRRNPGDLASRAIEEMQQPQPASSSLSHSSIEAQVAAMRQQRKTEQTDARHDQLSAASFRKGRSAPGVLSKVIPLVIIVMALGGLYMALGGTPKSVEDHIEKIMPAEATPAEAKQLYNQGKFIDAVAKYESIGVAKLSAGDKDTYYKACLGAGKQQQKEGDATGATDTLKKIPAGSSSFKAAQDLLKKKSTPPPKSGRRRRN